MFIFGVFCQSKLVLLPILTTNICQNFLPPWVSNFQQVCTSLKISCGEKRKNKARYKKTLQFSSSHSLVLCPVSSLLFMQSRLRKSDTSLSKERLVCSYLSFAFFFHLFKCEVKASVFKTTNAIFVFECKGRCISLDWKYM